MKFTLTENTQTAFVNCLQVAADRFKENADTFRQLEAAGGNGFMSAQGAAQMAAQFDQQAVEARGFVQIFQNAQTPMEVEFEQDMDDDENPFHPESPEGREWQRQFDKAARAA